VLAGAAVALMLLWLIVLDPLQRDSDRLVDSWSTSAGALVEARRQANEIAGLLAPLRLLSRATHAPPSRPRSREATPPPPRAPSIASTTLTGTSGSTASRSMH
jgi:hypothetical protein